eukprot:199963-Prymnesium_polylepis.1
MQPAAHETRVRDAAGTTLPTAAAPVATTDDADDTGGSSAELQAPTQDPQGGDVQHPACTAPGEAGVTDDEFNETNVFHDTGFATN